MSNNLSQTTIDIILALRKEGNSIRTICFRTTCGTSTVKKYIALYGLHEITCECGQSINHRGWCQVRFARSERRKAFMRYWHLQKPTCDAVPDSCYLGSQ